MSEVTMRAMVLEQLRQPLMLSERALPRPARGEIRIAIEACAVCRTDLHVVDGDLPCPVIPIVPGHQIVGAIDAIGDGVPELAVGDRVGVPWLGSTCGSCQYCAGDRENLCR